MSGEKWETELVDPEPLSALIIALGAAGSIASILSFVETRQRAREAEREANRFAIRDAIMGAETALNELRALVRSLEIIFAAGSDPRPKEDALNALAQFGRVRLTFTRDGHERWNEIQQDLLACSMRLQRHMGNLMRHFATANLRLRSHLAERIQQTVEQLNSVMSALSNVHFGELFRSLVEVIGNCNDLMRELRIGMDEWLR